MRPLTSFRRGLLLALLAGTFALAGLAHAQSKDGPLVVEVSHAGKVSLAGDTELTVELRNTGAVTLTLPARPGWDKDGGLELQVTRAGSTPGTAKKVPLQPDPARDTRLTGSRRGVPLPAGEAIGLYRTVKTRDLFGAVGEYDVVVVYRGLAGGDVVSAPLRISVGL